jgi:hypothetical protein
MQAHKHIPLYSFKNPLSTMKLPLALIFILFFVPVVSAQSLQVHASAGVDFASTYRAQEQPGWPLLRGRHFLPLISAGFNKMTAAGNLHSLSVLLTAENHSLESDNPLVGNAGETSYYRNAVQYEIMFPLSETGRRHQLFIGYAVSAAHGLFRFSPSSSFYFPQTRREVMLEGGGSLQYRHKLQSGAVFFGAFNLNIIRTALEWSRVENPLLTEEQQTGTLFEMELGSRAFVRAGMCVNLTQNSQ